MTVCYDIPFGLKHRAIVGLERASYMRLPSEIGVAPVRGCSTTAVTCVIALMGVLFKAS